MKLAQTPASGNLSGSDSAPSRAETAVREILREILVRPPVPVEEFDSSRPLEELGCDSIDLIQLAATLKQRFGVALEGEQGAMPRWSIRELAAHIEREQSAAP